jgi:hypothetical protein
VAEKDMIIRTVLAQAGAPRADGTVFKADVLRAQTDNKTYFWDEATQSLYYQGPMPAKKEG